MKRRDFLKTAFGAAAVTSFSRSFAAEPAASFKATDRIFLGPRKIECSRLFLGTGTNGWNHQSNQTRQLGIQGLADFFRAAFDEGLTSWDSADQYGSHPHLAKALADGVPRNKVTILTKSRAKTADAMRADIARFQEELGTKTLDILLLHCLEDPDWTTKMRPVMDIVDEFQEKGVVRTKGVSCHSLGALKAAAKEPWVEVDLARINPHGAVMDADPKTVVPVLREMKAAGKGVIGMKIFGAGQLVDRRDECLRYVLNLDCVDAFTIGCESAAQRQELLTKISRTPRIPGGQTA
ncbi:MAG: aldo/keto reductase [Chthoniobacterales bacterium]